MASSFLLPGGFLIAMIVWAAISHALLILRTRVQHEVASRGECCQGKVVAIQRPFMLERSTRLYFDFEPPGADRLVRACHIYLPTAEESTALLPPTGTVVTIRYLPERPQQAVIGKLVTG